MMRHFALVLGLMIALFSMTAHADEAYIAQLRYTGGFIAPAYQNSGVRILQTGEVVQFRNDVDIARLGQLDAGAVAALMQAVANAQPGALVDQDAGKPLCVDRPRGSYTVQNAAGQAIEVAASDRCHRLVNPLGVGGQVQTILDGFEQLALLNP